ncbi:MAG: hypothetical protein ACRD4T_00240 [Candidatus Acidiferrales bacterium]
MDIEMDKLMNQAMPIATVLAKHLEQAQERHPEVVDVVVLTALRMVRNRMCLRWGSTLRRQMEDLERRLDRATVGQSPSLIIQAA